MSFQAMTWARGIKTGSATTKAVLLAVANYADEEGVCWPSQEQLADDTELSRHSIMRALDTLEDAGLLERERRHRGDGSRTSDLIMLDLSSTELRSRQQRCTQQQPKSHSATAEPSIEPSLSRNTGGRVKRQSDEDAAVRLWNEVAGELGLPTVQRMTKTRSQRLAQRLKDCGGLTGWQMAMDKIRGSPLCRGEVGKWSADFDFVLQEKSFVKLMEGAYDDRSPGRTATASSNSRAQNDAILDAILAETKRRENGEGDSDISVPDARAA
jgi:biotin operon repressor